MVVTAVAPEPFGLPRDDPLFVAALLVHVSVGVVCVASGATAMVASKGGSAHRRAGRTFAWGVVGVLGSMAVLTGVRWEHNAHLVPIGLVAGAAATVGVSDRRRVRPRDPVHLTAMGTAFIALLTGFYVDNGPNLPVWDRLPSWLFWLLPSVAGYPIVIWALGRRRRGPATVEREAVPR